MKKSEIEKLFYLEKNYSRIKELLKDSSESWSFNILGKIFLLEGDCINAYNYFMNDWQNYCDDAGSYNGDFPDKIFDEALKCWRKGIEYEPSKNEKPLKDVFSDFNGLYTQIDFFGEYKNQIDLYSTPFDPKDLTNDFFFMRKFVINYLLYLFFNFFCFHFIFIPSTMFKIYTIIETLT